LHFIFVYHLFTTQFFYYFSRVALRGKGGGEMVGWPCGWVGGAAQVYFVCQVTAAQCSCCCTRLYPSNVLACVANADDHFTCHGSGSSPSDPLLVRHPQCNQPPAPPEPAGLWILMAAAALGESPQCAVHPHPCIRDAAGFAHRPLVPFVPHPLKCTGKKDVAFLTKKFELNWIKNVYSFYFIELKLYKLAY